MIVKLILFIEAFCNKPYFILVECAIIIFFDSKYLLAAYGFYVGWERSKCPSVFGNKGIILLFHCFKLVRLK